MENLLNSFSALHNFKQANGLNVADASSVSAYVLERKLMRIFTAEITPKTIRIIAKREGFTVARIEDIVEGKLYDLQEEELISAIETFEESGIGACLKFLDKL